MSGLTPQSRQQMTAISVGGNEEPIDPVYTASNRQSALGTEYPIPSEPAWDPHRAPLVVRGQDTRGMRYLYADMRQAQPISPLGTGPDLGVATWSSSFQKSLGTLRDWGFYDLLYRAGYPGFNLGISFKVAQNPNVGTAGGNNTMGSPIRPVVVNVFKRVSAAASNRG